MYNSFEKNVMEMLLQGDDPVLKILYKQNIVSKVCKRKSTGVGFFTTFSVPENVERIDDKSFKFGDVTATIDGLQHGAGFLLYVEHGFIHTLEGYTYDEEWPKKIINYKLDYTNGKRDLVSLSKIWTDKNGNQWYAQTTKNGEQVWVEVYEGQIRNGGLNTAPKTFNPETGLSSPLKLQQKGGGGK
ncbi:MAG TPA: hypothetical protein DDX47_01610 [Candidatus Jacksonbacteria bacterium]|nr:hypothetical protein [Candidatus Jacksonbacteria bacterium]